MRQKYCSLWFHESEIEETIKVNENSSSSSSGSKYLSNSCAHNERFALVMNQMAATNCSVFVYIVCSISHIAGGHMNISN